MKDTGDYYRNYYRNASMDIHAVVPTEAVNVSDCDQLNSSRGQRMTMVHRTKLFLIVSLLSYCHQTAWLHRLSQLT